MQQLQKIGRLLNERAWRVAVSIPWTLSSIGLIAVLSGCATRGGDKVSDAGNTPSMSVRITTAAGAAVFGRSWL